MPGGVPEFDGIILAGASSKRFDGRDKALVQLAGRSFLQLALDVLADARRTLVVGPPREGFGGCEWIAEDPPDGGPVTALAAGIEATASEIVVVLAVDMPLVTGVHVHHLVTAMESGGRDATALADPSGRVAYLAAAYRRAPLARRLASLSELNGARLGDVVRNLDVRTLESEAARDCDSPEELAELEAGLSS